MALTLRALHPWFGVEVLDVDVARVDDATYRDIAEAFDQHSVLLFRGQRLDDREQIAFSERFGPLETTIRSIASQARTLPEISNLSNVDAEERLIPRGDKRSLFHAGNRMWHSDSSFKRIPALASLLSAREVPPEGGETQYASMRVAYDRLTEEERRLLDGKVAVHSFTYSRGLMSDGLFEPEHAAQVPPVRQALVRANPTNGRKAFYVGSHACEIVGMPTDAARALIQRLVAAATRPELRLHAPVAGRRPGHVGQPVHAAPRSPLGRGALPAGDAPHDSRGRQPDRGGRRGDRVPGTPGGRRVGPDAG